MRTKLLKKSEIENKILIKTIEDTSRFMKLPIAITGNEKNKDKNNGINIKANGIKNLKESSKVSE